VLLTERDTPGFGQSMAAGRSTPSPTTPGSPRIRICRAIRWPRRCGGKEPASVIAGQLIWP